MFLRRNGENSNLSVLLYVDIPIKKYMYKIMGGTRGEKGESNKINWDGKP